MASEVAQLNATKEIAEATKAQTRELKKITGTLQDIGLALKALNENIVELVKRFPEKETDADD